MTKRISIAVDSEAIQRRVIALEKRVGDMADKLAAVDPCAWRELAAHHAELLAKFRRLIHKCTVATELAYLSRRQGYSSDLPAAVLYCFDLPDEWWGKDEDAPLGWWVERVMIEYRKATA